MLTMETVIWLGILFCLSQSAIFSGSNLAFFSLSRLQLEVESEHGNPDAQKILSMRQDSNFLLATILWGNVGINVLLTMLSDSVMAGISAFLFSTIAITFLGEIIPQAYFSRNALKVASFLSPIIRFYQLVLFIFAKPTGIMLDLWLGKEGITFYREEELKGIIQAHVEADEAEVVNVEGIGALNFLAVDEVPVSDEGEILDPNSIISCDYKIDMPILPEQGTEGFDDFVKKVNQSGHKWGVFVNDENQPLLVIDVDSFVRSATLDSNMTSPYDHCHRPVIIEDGSVTLGNAMQRLKNLRHIDRDFDGVINEDVILFWGSHEQKMITGADILGRLMRGIGNNDNQPSQQ